MRGDALSGLLAIKNKIRLPARASVLYLMTGAIAKGVGLITTPLFTRLMSGEEYGNFTLYMTLLGVGSMLLSAFSQGSAVYSSLAKNKHDPFSVIGPLFVLVSAISVVICTLLFAFSWILSIPPLLFLPLLLQLLCDGFSSVAQSYARFYYRSGRVCSLSLIGSVAPPLLSALIYFLGGRGYLIRIICLLIFSVLSAALSLMLLCPDLRKGRVKAQKQDYPKRVRWVMGRALPMLPHSISGAICSGADKLIIGYFMGAAALAAYSVVHSIGVSMQFIITAIGSALSPWMIRRLEGGEEERIGRLITPMTVCYSALSLFLIGLGPEAMLILAPEGYSAALPALMPIALSLPFSFISSAVSVATVHQGRGGDSLILSAVSSALCLILDLALIPPYGFLGAGISLLISQTASALLGVGLIHKTKAKNMLPHLKTAAASLCCMPLGIMLSRLRFKPLVRIILLSIPSAVILLALAFVYKMIKEKETVLGS